MRPSHQSPLLPILAGALALTVAPGGMAQAGLSGNALEGQMEALRGAASSWDKGMQSRSALGQLEEMTGTKVDRSKQPTRTQQSSAIKPKLSSKQQFNRAMNAAVADALADVLLSVLMSDNSAAKAQAEAEAQAAAEAAAAEAARVAEAARQARIKQAADLRSFQDAQDRAMTSNLAGAFDLPTGTSFFGQPVNPDADAVARLLSRVDDPHDEGDATVVALPDHPSLVVDPTVLGPPIEGVGLSFGSGTAYLPSGIAPIDQPAASTRPTLTPRNAAEELALHAAGMYGDKMQGAVKDHLQGIVFGRLIAKLERLPGYESAKVFLDLQGKYEQLKHPFDTFVDRWENAFTQGTLDTARLLGSNRTSDHGLGDAFGREVNEMGYGLQRDARTTALDVSADHTFGSPEFGSADELESGDGFFRPLHGVARSQFGHIRIGP